MKLHHWDTLKQTALVSIRLRHCGKVIGMIRTLPMAKIPVWLVVLRTRRHERCTGKMLCRTLANQSADGGEMSDKAKILELVERLRRFTDTVEDICDYNYVANTIENLANENAELRHDIAHHVQICADQANEIAELRKQLTFVEAFADPPDTNTGKTTRDELRNQLEQAEARCENLWDEIARIHGGR